MIVRERTNDIVMITQNDHAHISGVCAANWEGNYFSGESRRESVELAIIEHDRGWISADENPLWNDQKELPYSFIDYPTDKKIPLYKMGIEEVVKVDAYAGILCSQHYSRFISRNKGKLAEQFVHDEEIRRNNLKKEIAEFNSENFQFHYDLLAFFDNLSLYACLNEPGVSKDDEHYFFREGIPIPSTFSFLKTKKLNINWKDERTILLSDFPFKNPFSIKIDQKVVSKSQIRKQGLLSAFQDTAVERLDIDILPES